LLLPLPPPLPRLLLLLPPLLLLLLLLQPPVQPLPTLARLLPMLLLLMLLLLLPRLLVRLCTAASAMRVMSASGSGTPLTNGSSLEDTCEAERAMQGQTQQQQQQQQHMGLHHVLPAEV
jgi:hypothetical protein